MTKASREDLDLAVVRDLMHEAANFIGEHPGDFIPRDMPIPESDSSDTARSSLVPNIERMLADPKVRSWLQEIIDSWPKNLMPTFLQASAIISQVLEAFGAREGSGMMGLLKAGMLDIETVSLMMAWAQLSREEASKKDESEGSANDPTGMQYALFTELQRRGTAHHVPFARTLTTLLGQDALLWLTAMSQDGHGKIQPHEFTRTGWHRIWSIENQLAIEQELLAVPAEAQYLGKIVVALSWTLVALASHMPPTIFLGELLPHVSSTREGQYTVSVGGTTYTIVEFEQSAMQALVGVLAEGLTNPLLSAADLMWIGAGLARVCKVHSGHGEAIPSNEERFGLFLSHRGRDAKLSLAKVVQAMPEARGVFLDCLVLPRSVVNRSFVFSSLAQSDSIIIVETENFSESAWCRKEAWFADALAARGLAKVERLNLLQAELRAVAEGQSSWRRRPRRQLSYPIAQRVLKDVDYWARRPNLHSLKEAGRPTECLAPLQTVFETEPLPNDVDWVLSIGQAVEKTFSAVVAAAPDAEPFDLWATALQYSLAAFGLTSSALSKMEVRRRVDQMNAVLKSVITARLHQDPIFKAHAPGYLTLIAAAAAIQLAHFELDPRMTPALRLVLGDTIGLRDGVLLLDVRQRGARRSLHLHLLAALVRGGLGSVGIVQDAADEVHQTYVADLPLEVLPCVTLYPGMESPFDSVAPR